MEQNEIREMLRSGIEAARNGNSIIARDYFRRVLEADPENTLAWLWMAQAADRPSERRQALQRVLQIDPGNEKARAALERMDGEDSEYYSVPGAISSTAARPAPASGKEPAQNEPFEENRDWFQPVQRPKRDTDLWSEKGQNDIGLAYLLGIAIALAIIGIAVFLLFTELENQNQENETATSEANAFLTRTALAELPVDEFVTAAPTRTLRPTSPIELTPRNTSQNAELPPVLEPTITNTPLPSNTPTPIPPGPEIFEVLIVSNESAGAAARLFSASGDGSGLMPFDVDVAGASSVDDPVTQPEPPAEEEEVETQEEAAPTEEEPAPEVEESTTEGEPTEESATEEVETSENSSPLLLFQGARVELLDPDYAPTGEFIVFTLQQDEIQELYTMSANGQQVRQLTSLGASETRGARYSPDGETIIFHSNADGDFDLYTISPGGGAPTNITNNNVSDRDPDWSPDGGFVAFASDRAGLGTLEIFVLQFGGEVAGGTAVDFQGLCQMTDSQNSSFAPSWSPDGQLIAFISNRDRDNDLYVMRFDGANERIVSFGDGFNWQDRAPSWSPDSRWIAVSTNRLEDAFDTDNVNPTSKIWIVQPDGTEWTPVTTGESNDLSMTWEPSLFGITDVSDFQFSCAAG